MNAPHIFDVINYWPQKHRQCLGTSGLPEGWMWHWMGDDWVLSNGAIGLKRDDWFKYNNEQTATKEEVMSLIDTWPTDYSKLRQEVTKGWIWSGLSGRIVVINQVGNIYGGITITENDWREYLVDMLRKNPPVELGTKSDSGKPMMGCIPPHAELAVARVLTFGAQKYSRGNWAHVENSDERYMDAALRHINSYRRGENTDSETGESHLAHAICCLMFMLDKSESK